MQDERWAKARKMIAKSYLNELQEHIAMKYSVRWGWCPMCSSAYGKVWVVLDPQGEVVSCSPIWRYAMLKANEHAGAATFLKARQ